jgi:hypothetical protein
LVGNFGIFTIEDIFDCVDNDFISYHGAIIVAPSAIGVAITKQLPSLLAILENFGRFHKVARLNDHDFSPVVL